MPPAYRSSALALLLLAAHAPAISASPATTNPTTTASDEKEVFAREHRESIRDLQAGAPVVPARPIDQLIHLDIDHGRLFATLAEPNMPDEQCFALAGAPDSAFRLSVRTLGGTPPVVVLAAHLIRFDAASSRAVNVELLPAVGTINLSVTLESLGGTTTIQLIENSPPDPFAVDAQPASARLYLQHDSETAAVDASTGRLNFVEANFADIIEKHHDDAVATLGEGLTAIRAMHVLAGVGHDEAAAIFDADRGVTDATRRELDVIVSSVREGGSGAVAEARTRLRKLGPSAAAALSRLPRDGWSPDLALNVDALTAGLMPSANDRGPALLASSSRLVDLLYSPDVNIRRDAKSRLEVLLKTRITLDVQADPYANTATIESLRPKPASPTTQE